MKAAVLVRVPGEWQKCSARTRVCAVTVVKSMRRHAYCEACDATGERLSSYSDHVVLCTESSEYVREWLRPYPQLRANQTVSLGAFVDDSRQRSQAL